MSWCCNACNIYEVSSDLDVRACSYQFDNFAPDKLNTPDLFLPYLLLPFFASGIIALAMIKYMIKPGIMPVTTIKIRAMMRTRAGSVSKYSAIPPATPDIFLSCDRVSTFLAIKIYSSYYILKSPQSS